MRVLTSPSFSVHNWRRAYTTSTKVIDTNSALARQQDGHSLSRLLSWIIRERGAGHVERTSKINPYLLFL